jgi:Fe-S cluster assembly ATP-binding protein
MLEIKNLHAGIGGKKILQGINLKVNAGEVHAIMGPNGSGKSTLSQVLAGRESYQVTEGEVLYRGHDLLEMAPEDRAREGIFMAFQYPVEIPGVNNTYFLKAALNAVRKHRGEPELDAMDFLKLVRAKLKVMEMDESLINRSVNEGFSGGEKKRNEIFHMAVLDPKLAILDETDSGLDIAPEERGQGVTPTEPRASDDRHHTISDSSTSSSPLCVLSGEDRQSAAELALDLEAKEWLAGRAWQQLGNRPDSCQKNPAQSTNHLNNSFNDDRNDSRD